MNILKNSVVVIPIKKKKVGYFEVENIDKANIITIALNPKEYYERFVDTTDNKRHKGYIDQLQVWILIHILPAYQI